MASFNKVIWSGISPAIPNCAIPQGTGHRQDWSGRQPDLEQ